MIEQRGINIDMTEKDERLYAMLIYLTSFFTTFIGPLVIWIIKREESSLVDFHGKQYLNFLISYAIYSFVGTILIFVIIGIVALIALGIMAFVFTIIAAIKAYDGKYYKIPTVIQFIK
ncbi:DUF4870 domain-containing protein [Lentibacillus sp. JNUCC-1]|uniref:DUF4870 domain-containing protein n=1 Tax=Lentibacillus sp. JNUCC-1 TaxID=2654513 RepID=UPI001E2A6958|nr:DUF4870 domain-containing protein [Lentibacillus sp. JNUCC-1]